MASPDLQSVIQVSRGRGHLALLCSETGGAGSAPYPTKPMWQLA